MSFPAGVGNNEKSLSAVGRTNVGRSYNAPLRIEPHFGKVTEDFIESERKVPCDVLKHDESWS